MPELLIDATRLSKASTGVGRYTSHLVHELCRRLPEDWQIHAAIVERDYDDVPARIRPHIHYVRRSSELFDGLVTLPRLMRNSGAEYLLLPADAVTAIGGYPAVTVVHDIPELISRAGRTPAGFWRKSVDATKKILRQRMLRKCSAVICNSNFTAKEVVETYGISREKIRIGYCGVDERFFSEPSLLVSDWLRPEWVARGYILVFATGDARERFDICAEMFAQVRAVLPDKKLIVAGVRPGEQYAAELEADLAARGCRRGEDVEFVPFLGEADFDKLHSLYRGADFYVELSGHEGFGVSPAEAMASGTACISSGAGALDEIGGGYPVKTREHSASAFADAVTRAYLESVHRHDRKSQIEFCRRYSWEAVGALVSALLQDCHALRSRTASKACA